MIRTVLTTIRWTIAVAVLATLAASTSAAAVDPFYENLLGKGTEAFNRRDYPEAARLLRLACFGLLDEPEVLADGLTRLGLAQALSNDADGFRDTFMRLGEVEDRFDGWSAAPIPEELRTAFRRQASRLLSAATLNASPLMMGAPTPLDADLAKLTPAKRRQELEKRIAQHPREPRWRLLLARLDLAEGRVDEAMRSAEAALALTPGSWEGLFLRGLAFAGREEWDRAVADLQASGRATRDPAAAAAMLRGLTSLGRSDEARRFAASLPAAVAADERVSAAVAGLDAAPGS